MGRSPLPVICCLLLCAHLLPAQEVKLDDLLDSDVDQLMNISIISASKHVEKISRVPATVKVITGEQIRDRGYLVLEDVLGDLPGFQFRNSQSFNSYSFLRGIPNQNNLILVMIDGVQINELNSGGFYGGGHYNLSNVERVEVVYGPGSATYGTNAISGIINIIKKKADARNEKNLSIRYGSFQTLNLDGGASLYDPERDIGLRLSGMIKSGNRADLAGAAGDFNWSDNLETWEEDYAFDARLDTDKLTMGLNFQQKNSSSDTYFKTSETDNLEGTNWNIRFVNTYLKYKFTLNTDFVLTPKIYYRNASVLNDSVFIRNSAGQQRFYRPNNLIGAELLLDYSPDQENALIAGIQYERENLASRFSISSSETPEVMPPQPPEPEMLENSLTSVFAQLNKEINPYLRLVGGFRFDSSSVYDQVFTPRAGIIVAWENLTTKLLFTEAFRAPKPWDYTNGSGNSELKPEEMQSLELINSLQVSQSLRIGMSLYRNRLENLFISEVFGDSFRWINSGEIETIGFELDGEYQVKEINLYGNYTFTSSEENLKGEIPEISRHNANIGVTYTYSEKLKFNFRGNYLGKRLSPEVIDDSGKREIAAALIFSSNFTLQANENVDLILSLRNMFDQEYYHTSNRPPSRYRQQQRAFLVTLVYHF